MSEFYKEPKGTSQSMFSLLVYSRKLRPTWLQQVFTEPLLCAKTPGKHQGSSYEQHKAPGDSTAVVEKDKEQVGSWVSKVIFRYDMRVSGGSGWCWSIPDTREYAEVGTSLVCWREREGHCDWNWMRSRRRRERWWGSRHGRLDWILYIIIIKQLLCARHCARHLKYRCEQSRSKAQMSWNVHPSFWSFFVD